MNERAGAETGSADHQNILLVCGLPSSGTELLALVLSAHPRILVRGEFPLLARLAGQHSGCHLLEDVSKTVSALRRTDVYDCLENANARFDVTARILFGDVFARLLTDGDYDWVGHKTPQNLENLSALLKLFPRARIIVLVRDPRDVAVSWVRRWGKDPLLLAHKWASRYGTALQLLSALGKDRFLVVRYEDLLSQLQAEVARLCEFLDVDFSDRMLRYHEFVDRVLPRKVNFGRPIIQENVGKYRGELGRLEQQRIEEICFRLIEILEYSLEFATAEIPITLWEQVRGRIKETTLLAVPGVGPAGLSGREWLRRLQIEFRKRL